MQDIKQWGAAGDGQALDREAIQQAIDDCHLGGGGTLYFPAGEYLTGTLELKSGVTLYLGSGAVLKASTAREHYEAQEINGRHIGFLLIARGASRIGIVGEGTIHGQGFEDVSILQNILPEYRFRRCTLMFTACDHVVLRGISILYSDYWTVHLKQCRDVRADGLTIRNNPHRINSDGINPDSCRNVLITGCHLTTGDDCIALKTTEPAPCENIIVSSCILNTLGYRGIKFGTESFGDFRNVIVSGCTIRTRGEAIGFFIKDGAHVENVQFANLIIDQSGSVGNPIFMDVEKRYADSRMGSIRDVLLRDVQLKAAAPVLLQGCPEAPIRRVCLDNVTHVVTAQAELNGRTKPTGSRYRDEREDDGRFASVEAYLTAAYVDGLEVSRYRIVPADDTSLRTPWRLVSGYYIRDGRLAGVRAYSRAAVGEAEPFAWVDCESVEVQP